MNKTKTNDWSLTSVSPLGFVGIVVGGLGIGLIGWWLAPALIGFGLVAVSTDYYRWHKTKEEASK